MQVNRRTLLKGVGTLGAIAALGSPARAWFPHGAVGNTNNNHVMAELFNLSGGTNFPFINQMSAATSTFYDPAGGVADYSLFDSAGWPTAFAGGQTDYRVQVPLYFAAGDSWVFTYNGNTGGNAYQVQLGGTPPTGILFTNTLQSVGRVEWSMALDTAGVASWDSGTSYTGSNAAQTSGGRIWSCLKANTGVDPTTDNGVYWQEIKLGYSFSYTVHVTPSSPYVTNIQIYRKSFETSPNGLVSSCTSGTCSGTTLDLTSGTFKGQVNIGDEVFAAGIPDATKIVKQLTGTTGLAGTYQISNSATVSTPVVVTTHDLFNPLFISTFKDWGALRFVQWMASITDNHNILWEDRPVRSQWNWLGAQLSSAGGSKYAGTATQSGNDYTGNLHVAGSPTSWTHGQLIQLVFNNAATQVAIASVDQGYPTTVHATGHGFSNGDIINFGPDYVGNNPVSVPAYNSANTYQIGALASFSGRTYQTQRFNDVGSPHSPDPSIDNSTNPYWRAISGATARFVDAAGYLQGFWTISNVTTNTFDIAADSTYWGTGAVTGFVIKQIRAADAGLPLKRLCGTDGGTFGIGVMVAGRLYNLVYDSVFDALIFQYGPDKDGGLINGMPLEIVVAMANKLNVNPWLCLPAFASTPFEIAGGNDYWTQAATYVKNNLKSSLKAYWEYSDEIWNGALGFIATGYANSQAKLRWGNDVRGYNGSAYGFYSFNWYGWHFYYAMKAVSTVFSGQMNRVVRVMAEWSAQYGLNGATQVLRHQALDASNVCLAPDYPIKFADACAIAPYITAPTILCQFTASTNGSGQLVVSSIASGPIFIGLQLYGTNGDVPAYTTITGQVSGSSGDVGTYTLSTSSLISLGSETMYASPIHTQMIYDYVYSGNPTLQDKALAALDSQIRNVTPTDGYAITGAFTEWDNQNVLYPSWKTLVNAENTNGLYGAGLNLKLICYEGGMGFNVDVNNLSQGQNNAFMWSTRIGPTTISGKTISTTDLLYFCYGYYESNYCANLLKDDITAYISAGAGGVKGENWAQYPLTGGWGNSMFGAINGTEFSPTWPSLTELQKFNSTGVP